MIVSLTIATVLLTATSVLVMAEEFQQLPKTLQKISSTLVHHRKSRTAFICGVVIIMSLASSTTLILPSSSKIDYNRLTSTVSTDLNAAPPKASYILQNSRSLITEKSLPSKVDVEFYLSANVQQNFTLNLELDNTNISLSNKNLKGNTKSTNNQIEIMVRNKRYINTTKNTDTNKDTEVAQRNNKSEIERDCSNPEYIVFTWVLCLISLATALKLYYLVKAFLAVFMLTTYTALIFVHVEDVFDGDIPMYANNE